jgi:peroxisomal 3,2-trans-enoyl-CoA isomerase
VEGTDEESENWKLICIIFLNKIVCSLQASEMLYFGHQMGPHEAKECGLVSQVFPHASFEQEVWPKLEQFVQMPKQVMLEFFL